MKRILLIMLAAGIIPMAFAQGRNSFPRDLLPTPPAPQFNRDSDQWERMRDNMPRVNAESVTVSGELTIAHGLLAVIDSGITYLAMGLDRFIGFIDSLKDGAAVTLEGNAISISRDGQTRYLIISKLTIGGKDYDMGMPGMDRMMNMLPNTNPAMPRNFLDNYRGRMQPMQPQMRPQMRQQMRQPGRRR